MFGRLGAQEMVFILVVLMLLFGAKRLPEIGSSLGKGIRDFKKSVHDLDVEPARTRADLGQGSADARDV